MAAIRNLTRGTVVAERAVLATGPVQRMAGLLSRSRLDEGEAMVFPRCRAIHTWLMRFPIDVVFLNTAQGSGLWAQGKTPSPEPRAPSAVQGVIVKIIERLKPFRFAWARGADTVIELTAGAAREASLNPGELLEIA